MTVSTIPEASWRELFSRQYLPKLVTLALALWLHASNSMLTATTMPSAVDEIGGLNLISWTFALYLAGSISAAASISLLVASLGLKATMIRAALVELSHAIGNLMVWRFVARPALQDLPTEVS